MELTIFASDAVWYSPDYKDNRDLPEDQRFAVEILPMTAHEMRRVEESHGKITKAKINFSKRYNAIREAVLRRCVSNVKNLFVSEVCGGKRTRKEIKDVSGLVQIAPEEVLEDIFTAIKDNSILDDGIVKNSDAPSALRISQEKSAGGIVPAVIPTSGAVNWQIQNQPIPNSDSQTTTSAG